MTVVAAPVLTPPVSTVAPSLSGPGRVGTPMLVDTGVWSGDPTPVLSPRWRRNGAEISGAAGAEYTPVAADDGADLDCVVTAVNAAGSAEAATETVQVTWPAPVGAGVLADLVLDQGPGARTLDASGAFAGAALAFGVSGAGASVDPATGLVSIPLDAPRAAETVTVTATNSGGSASVSFAVTVVEADTAAPVLTAGAIYADATPAALSIASNEGGVAYWMIDANASRTGTQVETGGGEGSGSFAAASGSNTHDVDVSGLAAGVWHVHTMVKDAAGNRSNVISTPFEIEEAAAPPGGITLGRSAVVINDTMVNGAASYTGGPFTVGSEAARILVAIIHGYSTTNQTVPTDIAVSFGGVAMTQRQAPVIQAFQRAWTAIYTLTDPASGTATVSAAWTLATRAAAITLVEVSGVDQSAPVVASGSQLYGSGANVTAAAFTRADGDLILSGLALGSGGKESEIATDGTLLQSGQTGAAGTSDTSFAVAHAPGGHGYTWTTGDKAALGWIELKAA